MKNERGSQQRDEKRGERRKRKSKREGTETRETKIHYNTNEEKRSTDKPSRGLAGRWIAKKTKAWA